MGEVSGTASEVEDKASDGVSENAAVASEGAASVVAGSIEVTELEAMLSSDMMIKEVLLTAENVELDEPSSPLPSAETFK